MAGDSVGDLLGARGLGVDVVGEHGDEELDLAHLAGGRVDKPRLLGLDDLSMSVVNYGDVPAIVEASYFVPGTYRDCAIVGDRGTLVTDLSAGSVVFHAQEFKGTGTAWEAIDHGKEGLAVSEGEPLKLELAAFLAACAGRGPNLVTAEAGLHAVAIVEAAARSSALGRLVHLDEAQ